MNSVVGYLPEATIGRLQFGRIRFSSGSRYTTDFLFMAEGRNETTEWFIGSRFGVVCQHGTARIVGVEVWYKHMRSHLKTKVCARVRP